MSSTGEAQRRSSARGRPVATSHGQIERAAFELFADRGFEGTTLDDIARAVGVGKRTLFRYFPSKNDIPWGMFGATLDSFRATLEAMPEELPVHVAVHRGVLSFNTFAPGPPPDHRTRMRLILTTPELQAHSVHQYAEWVEVIAEYVAARRGLEPTDLLPRVVGRVSLALALSAYDAWLADEEAELVPLVDEAMAHLEAHLAD